MKKKLMAAVLLLSLFLSGCSISESENLNLMTPPTLNAQQQQIKKALTSYTGEKIVLKFPENGENRSAFIEYTASTAANTGESPGRLVFYKPSTEGANIHINYLLSDAGGNWTSVEDIEGRPGDINSVEFADLDGDGRREIITTWTLSTTQQYEVAVYRLQSDNSLTLEYSEDYTEMSLVDLNGDMLKELLILSVDTVNKEANASLVQFYQGQEPKVIGQAAMDNAITSYASVKEGYMRQGKKAVYVDAYKDTTSMSTEILCWENGFLSNLTYYPDQESPTLRQTTLVSTDIDQDGIIEIPKSIELPGYSQAPYEEKQWLTSWFRYDEMSAKPVLSCVMNIADGYYFEFPDGWAGTITVQSDRNTRTMKFGVYQYDREQYGAFEKTLFSIRVMPTKTWKDEYANGWQLLNQKDNMSYCYQIDSGVTQREFSEQFAGGQNADSFIFEHFKLLQ